MLERCLGLGVIVPLTACGVSGLEESERSVAVNECGSDDECGVGTCSSGLCVARRGTIPAVLLEVTPSVTGGATAGNPMLHMAGELPLHGGALRVALDEVNVVAKIKAPRAAGCAPLFLSAAGGPPIPQASDGSIPARVRFTPVERALGLSVVSRTSEVETSSAVAGLPAAPARYDFKLALGAGAYDVYVEPSPLTNAASLASGCAFSPLLMRGLAVASGMPAPMELVLPVPAHLQLKIRVLDANVQLVGWTVDLVEPARGQVLSTQARLSLPSTSGGLSEYSLALDYLPVAAGQGGSVAAPSSGAAGDELVRLSPPEGTVAPTFFFERTALELFSKGSGVIDKLPPVANPVSVEGRVMEAGTGHEHASTVTFVATELAGTPAGVLASFTRRVETRAGGAFQVDLLPGKYTVRTAPEGPTREGEVPFALAETVWEIAPSPSLQAGRAIEVSPAIALSGRVVVPTGRADGARGATVSAEVSPTTTESDVLGRSLDAWPVVPRATSALITKVTGAFLLHADAGVFDLSVRPPDGSGFPWYVAPRLNVGPKGAPIRDLSPLQLPLPVRYEVRGEVTGSGGDRLTGALLRAYVLLDEDGTPTAEQKSARALLPVAETRFDDTASATLLVPALVNVRP